MGGRRFAADSGERSKARREQGTSWLGVVDLLRGGFRDPCQERGLSGRSPEFVGSNAVVEDLPDAANAAALVVVGHITFWPEHCLKRWQELLLSEVACFQTLWLVGFEILVAVEGSEDWAPALGNWEQRKEVAGVAVLVGAQVQEPVMELGVIG